MGKTTTLKRFKGLNNVSDPLRLGMDWLRVADNVDVSASGSLVRRPGYTRALAATPSGAYASIDTTRLYLVDGGVLKQVHPDLSTVALRAGLSAAPMHWAEADGAVYYANGPDKGIIMADGTVTDWDWPAPGDVTLAAGSGRLAAGTYAVVCTFRLPDGRETGTGPVATLTLPEHSALTITGIPQVAGLSTQVYLAPADSTVYGWAFATTATAATWNAPPDTLGAELTTHLLDPPPATASQPAFWRGRMYLLDYLPADDMTIVWFSEPLGYHLFDLAANFFAVPGRGTLLVGHADGLIVGTDRRIAVYDGESLKTLADYGVVPGWAAAKDDDDGRLLLWTARGLCAVLPFSNITQEQLSVRSGLQAGAAIVRANGQKKFVVALHQGGTAFNQRGLS